MNDLRIRRRSFRTPWYRKVLVRRDDDFLTVYDRETLMPIVEALNEDLYFSWHGVLPEASNFVMHTRRHQWVFAVKDRRLKSVWVGRAVLFVLAVTAVGFVGRQFGPLAAGGVAIVLLLLLPLLVGNSRQAMLDSDEYGDLTRSVNVVPFQGMDRAFVMLPVSFIMSATISVFLIFVGALVLFVAALVFAAFETTLGDALGIETIDSQLLIWTILSLWGTSTVLLGLMLFWFDRTRLRAEAAAEFHGRSPRFSWLRSLQRRLLVWK